MLRVYLCTYNGQRHIGAQLDSLTRQSFQDFDVLVSDDGSIDSTLRVVEGCRGRLGKGISVRQGPGRGPAANFLTALAEDDCGSALYAFCDQDDIWHEDKLERAVSWFASVPEDVPALYGTRVRIVDAEDKELGDTPLPGRPLSFANALVQNYAGGNTMVLNRAAHCLIRESLAGMDPASIPVHDWWAFLMVSGAGGIVHCDDYISLRYRQHGSNAVGARTTRFNALFGADALDWSERNLAGLKAQARLLTEGNRELLNRFVTARVASLPRRILFALSRNGVYRQTAAGQIGLLLRFVFKRV